MYLWAKSKRRRFIKCSLHHNTFPVEELWHFDGLRGRGAVPNAPPRLWTSLASVKRFVVVNRDTRSRALETSGSHKPFKWQAAYVTAQWAVDDVLELRSAYDENLCRNVIERADTFELLGICVSSDLSWNNHVTCISKRINSRLHFLRQLKRSAVSCKDMVLHCCRYWNAAPVWHSGLTAELVESLESVQKRALRVYCHYITFSNAADISVRLHLYTTTPRTLYSLWRHDNARNDGASSDDASSSPKIVSSDHLHRDDPQNPENFVKIWHGCKSSRSHFQPNSRSAFRPFGLPTRSRSNRQSVRFLYIDNTYKVNVLL